VTRGKVRVESSQTIVGATDGVEQVLKAGGEWLGH
jgi:hypothetical protein